MRLFVFGHKMIRWEEWDWSWEAWLLLALLADSETTEKCTAEQREEAARRTEMHGWGFWWVVECLCFSAHALWSQTAVMHSGIGELKVWMIVCVPCSAKDCCLQVYHVTDRVGLKKKSSAVVTTERHGYFKLSQTKHSLWDTGHCNYMQITV